MTEQELREKVLDFVYFAENFLMISDKSGRMIPFKLNRAQLYVYNRLKQQQQDLGMIRALILKGRQQGVSTLIQAYFFHRILTERGTSAFILAHLGEATRNLFEMTKKFDDYLPEGLAPKASQKSHNRLAYNALGSGYKVGTAGSAQIGRSTTIQLMHCSEYAFYDNIQELSSGLLQTVADIENTAILKESTANGQANHFYEEWERARSGDTSYMAIFVPWYWQDEYKFNADGFEPDSDERDLLELYAEDGLTLEHLAWRRKKIASFSGDADRRLEMFNQEYPFTDEEAFLQSNTNSFIDIDLVRKARENEVDSESSLIIGVDPAIGQNDRCVICRRRGRKAYNFESLFNLNTMEIASKIVEIIKREKPFKVFIDSIGIGAGTVDRLIELGYGDIVEGVDVRRKAYNKDKFGNLRAELWAEMRDWLDDDMGVDIPDSIEIQKDLIALGFEYNKKTQLFIESKEKAKKRGVKSPDHADSLACTFSLGRYVDTTGGYYNPARNTYSDNFS